MALEDMSASAVVTVSGSFEHQFVADYADIASELHMIGTRLDHRGRFDLYGAACTYQGHRILKARRY
jgi:hypothetical protein